MRTIPVPLVWGAVSVALVLSISGCVSLEPGPAVTSSSTPTTSGGQGIAVGEPDPNGGGGTLVRPAHEENETDGFHLTGDETVSGFRPGNNDTFSFVAENAGADAKALYDMCGDGNPSIRIEAPNGTTVATSPPQMRCMVAAYFGNFTHGAKLYRNLTWNGTVYEGSQARKADQGRYTVVGTFVAQRDGHEAEVVVRVPVNILGPQGGVG